jgi:predicted ATP-dependent serine protease
VACALEGTRPLLLEIQALVSQTDLAMPRRVGTGRRSEAARDDRRRALAARGLALGQADVFVNVAGGVRIDEPGADLAVALAIASAAKGVPLKASTASFGEVGLTGRLGPRPRPSGALRSARSSASAAVIVPKGTDARANVSLVEAETLRLACQRLSRRPNPAACVARSEQGFFRFCPPKKWPFPATFDILVVTRRRSSTRRRLVETIRNGEVGLVQSRR